jgi:hypothetical protein
MRTQDEVVARIREKRSIFSFDAEVLVHALDYEHAREFIGTTSREKWEATKHPISEEEAIRDFADYAAFAWGKAEDHRGLSAGRSVEKLEAWTWLLGRDDVLSQSENALYAMYGCPKLKVICEAFGFPIPDDEPVVRMMRGEPCTPDCDAGCRPRAGRSR